MREIILHSNNMLNLQVDRETNMSWVQKLSDKESCGLNALNTNAEMQGQDAKAGRPRYKPSPSNWPNDNNPPAHSVKTSC